MTRSYSRRAEPADDYDATVRRKKRSSHTEVSTTPPKAQDHRKFSYNPSILSSILSS